MPKIKARVSSPAAELPKSSNVKILPTLPPATSESVNEKGFECPLCVDDFKKFSQLKWHLLAMHPRRDMIMKLVKERYGISKRDAEATESETVDCRRHAHNEPSACCRQTAEKLESVVKWLGTSTEPFKAPRVPPKFRHRAPAGPQVKNSTCKGSYKELADSSRKQEFLPKKSPDEERSLWASYLSFCLSGSATSEPLPGGH